MADKRRHKGFSLTEVLISLGTLAVGMLFIAGVFPVSIHFTTVATERSIAAAAADEAFAKIKLYGINLSDPDLNDIGQALFEDVVPILPLPIEFAYPSTISDLSQKRYWWSAICKRIPNSISDLQVTVFVSRKVGVATQYPNNGIDSYRPIAVPVEVRGALGSDRLTVTGLIGKETFINAGCSIVDGPTGDIYRVLERDPLDDTLVRLDRRWQSLGLWPRNVWVVPGPVSGGKNPCIAVYQKVIRF